MTAAHPRCAQGCEHATVARGSVAGVQCASSLGVAAAELPALHRLGGGPRRMEKAAAHDYDNTAKHRIGTPAACEPSHAMAFCDR